MSSLSPDASLGRNKGIKSILSRTLSRRSNASTSSLLSWSSSSRTLVEPGPAPSSATTPDVATRVELDLTLPCATSDSPLRAANSGLWMCHVSQTPRAMLQKVAETISATLKLPQPAGTSLTFPGPPAVPTATPSTAAAAGWTARRTFATGAAAPRADPDATLHGLSLTSPPLRASADYAAIRPVCQSLRANVALVPDPEARARVLVSQVQHGGPALVPLKRVLTLLWFAEPLLFRLAGAPRAAGAAGCLARASNAAMLLAEVSTASWELEGLVPAGMVLRPLERLWAASSLVELDWLLAGDGTVVGVQRGEVEDSVVLALAHLRCSCAVERPGLVAQWTRLCHLLVEAGTAWPERRFMEVVDGMLKRQDPLELVALVTDGRMDHVEFWRAELAQGECRG